MSVVTYEEAREALDGLVRQECIRRATKVYQPLRIYAQDDKERKEDKAHLLHMDLHRWSERPLEWIRDMAWCPDPKDEFGAGAVPKELVRAGLAPKGMVPMILFDKQREWIAEFFRVIDGRGRKDLVLLKSRQVAFTSLMEWCGNHIWLFRDASPAVWTTYDDELIDPGGKGHRTADSLFGRQRLFLDAICSCVPSLRFNAHLKPHTSSREFRRWKTEEGKNRAGLQDSEDISKKLVRPKWVIHGREVFPGAEGNFILGDLPDSALARGQAVLYVWLDELGYYNRRRSGADWKAWGACGAASKVRVAGGTIDPEGDGTASLLYDLAEKDDGSDVLSKFFVSWTDMPPYMAGAWWTCDTCANRNPLAPHEGPGHDGTLHTCTICSGTQLVRYKHVRSKWYLDIESRERHNRRVMAAEYDMDWLASHGDRFFYTFDAQQAVTRRPLRQVLMFDGFDPGTSSSNPAAWISVAFDTKEQRPRIVGYWMGSDTMILWWLPFFKRWSPKQMSRMQMPYGKHAGEPWMRHFHYDELALKMLQRMNAFPMARGRVYGDFSGTHRNMGDSPYTVLQDYEVYVDSEYTADREGLCRKGIDWAARLEIDPVIAEICPPATAGTDYPSILQVFSTAKPMEQMGQSRTRIDVDKRSPPHVNHAADAWLYLCRGLPDEVHAVVDPGGGWSIEPYAPGAGVFRYGGDDSLA